MCFWVVARLPQKLKSTFFEKKFITSLRRSKKFQKTLILTFEANSALLSRQIELLTDFFVKSDFTNFFALFLDFTAMCNKENGGVVHFTALMILMS